MVYVVAPIRQAVHQVKGTTIWSYAGWRPRTLQNSFETLRINTTTKTKISRLAQTDIFILKEINIMENHHIERLNDVIQQAKAKMKRILITKEIKRLKG